MRTRSIVLALLLGFGGVVSVGSPPAHAEQVCYGTGVLETPLLKTFVPVVGGPANSGYLSGAIGICLPHLGVGVVQGVITGWCESAQGTMLINGGAGALLVFGSTIMLTGPQLYGVGNWVPFPGQSCLTGARMFQVTFGALNLGGPPLTLPPVTTTTTVSLPPIGGGDPTSSAQCTQPLHESTTLGVSTRVATHSASGATWVCVRFDNGSARYGGRVEITPGSPGSPPPNPVSQDGNVAACKTTAGNQAPGPHPYDEGVTAGVAHFVDAWSGPGEAWVCVQAGSTALRVKVQTGGGSSPTAPRVEWKPDAGTPG